MATSVGHGLIGIIVYAGASALPVWRKRLALSPLSLLAAAIAANLPDLDMVAGLLVAGDHIAFHTRGTHSIIFAAGVSGLVWLIMLRDREARSYAMLAFALVFSHVVVDALTGPQPGAWPSRGVELFWPFSDTRVYAPITLFKGVLHRDILPEALITASWELILLGPVAAASVVLANRSAGKDRETT